MCFYILAVVSNQSSLTRCVLALEGFPAPDRGGRTQPGGDSRTDSQQRRLAFPLALPQLIPDLPPRQDPEPQPGRGGGRGKGGGVPAKRLQPLRGRVTAASPPALPKRHSALSRQRSPKASLRERGGRARPQQAAAAGPACGDRGGGARAGADPQAAPTRLRGDAAPLTSSGARGGRSLPAGTGRGAESAASPRPRGSGGGPGCLRRSAGPGLGGAGRERTSAGRRHGG